MNYALTRIKFLEDDNGMLRQQYKELQAKYEFSQRETTIVGYVCAIAGVALGIIATLGFMGGLC
jgi:hypothetical protein